MTLPRFMRKSYKSIDTLPIMHLWILRILIPLGMHQELINGFSFADNNIAEFVGLSEWVNSKSKDFDPKAIKSQLQSIYKSTIFKLNNSKISTILEKNIFDLAKIVGLSQTDCRILEFAVMLHTEVLLQRATDLLGNLSLIKIVHVLSVLLDLSAEEIQLSLSAKNLLAKTGLLSFDKSNLGGLHNILNLLSDKFAAQILYSDTDPVNLLRDMVTLSTPPELSINDYEHISSILSILKPYLKNSILNGRTGVNILIYGVPGTGKSHLARVLAHDIDCQLFEITSEDEDGYPLRGTKRLRAFRAAQSFFQNKKSIILFDEVEDVFNDANDSFGFKSSAQISKAWMNRMLEENSIPALWLSNSIHAIDSAFIRRFDIIFELPVAPRKQREHIINQVCSALIDHKSIARMAQSESLAPAVVTRAASVIRSIQHELSGIDSSSAIELLINNTLKVQGHSPIKENNFNALSEIYDPSFINADADLIQIVTGLVYSKSGRLCLYGPPGTGKTAYGRWLANQIGLPLIEKRASDLMSKWVGGNEKNIAMAFKEAQENNALLLIDEVDSFLQDRRGAHQSWETTLVNEMLTQMESFTGIFVATTNLMDGFDQAALRRFDLKMKFDFMKAEQAWKLLNKYCNKLVITPPHRKHKARLLLLKNLTPGDFAAVARQNNFRPIICPTAFIDALEMECALKEGIKNSIGFLQ